MHKKKWKKKNIYESRENNKKQLSYLISRNVNKTVFTMYLIRQFPLINIEGSFQ